MTDMSEMRRLRLGRRFADAVYLKNPVMLMLGVAPLIMFSTTLKDGVVMSLSMAVAVVLSNALVSALQKFTPRRFRLMVYSVINAFVVTLLYCLVSAFLPSVAYELYAVLPFLIVNSVTLYRAEAYASQRGVLMSVFDAVCVGSGLVILTVIVSVLRELLGLGTLWGFDILGTEWQIEFISAPCGGFIITGCVLAAVNFINDKLGKGRRSM